MLKLSSESSSRFSFLAATVATGILACTALPMLSQESTCPTVAAHELSPAEKAYEQGKYAQAEDMFASDLAAHPQDLQLATSVIHTQLHLGEVAEADGRVNKLLGENPSSAPVLVALAEVQLRQGQPWQALETLKKAQKADPCYARTYLIRSRVDRIDSMHTSERAEIQKANEIDPTNSDIHRAWARTIAPAQQIEGVSQALATMKDIDEESRKRAEQSSRELLPLLTENNQTCQILPASGAPLTLPMAPVFQDARRVQGYRLEVELPKTKAHLDVDTAASGLFISRAVADQNGFVRTAGSPPGTVHVDSFHVGPLEFRDCIVGVNEGAFPGNSDGFIGTDLFTNYLVTLNFPAAKLALAALPPQPEVLPGDRIQSSELNGFTPVYHQQQFLLVPATLNNKTRQLFLLDSGIRFSTMIPQVAHAVSTTKVNFTNAVQTVSGSTLQVYRDSFDFQLANLSLTHQSHILEMESPSPDPNSSVQIAGKLGFDMLHSLILRLDYRDGLVQLEAPAPSANIETLKTNSIASSAAAIHESDCATMDAHDVPLSSTMQAQFTGLLDSARLKPGKEFTVKVGSEYTFPGCTLPENSILYGHITEVNASKGSGTELGMQIDHGDCVGQFKKALSLNLIGIRGTPDQYSALHSALPSEVGVSGGGRSISSAARNTGLPSDTNLNAVDLPKNIQYGMVIDFPKMKLEPQAGPGCSARLTSSEHTIHLGVGATLILAITSPQ
jgi:hypothetical protein